ncbi:MAG: hypothetical protein L0G70_07945, partial [Rubrobacter sp.]|nr:hypothetical protein [Rubrobacter sp.]
MDRPSHEREEYIVSSDEEGERLDRIVSSWTGMSRSVARRSVEDGLVRVQGESAGPSRRMRAGEKVSVEAPAEPELEAEDIAVAVVFEDEYVIVVDKPAGL